MLLMLRFVQFFEKWVRCCHKAYRFLLLFVVVCCYFFLLLFKTFVVFWKGWMLAQRRPMWPEYWQRDRQIMEQSDRDPLMEPLKAYHELLINVLLLVWDWGGVSTITFSDLLLKAYLEVSINVLLLVWEWGGGGVVPCIFKVFLSVMAFVTLWWR